MTRRISNSCRGDKYAREYKPDRGYGMTDRNRRAKPFGSYIYVTIVQYIFPFFGHRMLD